MRPTDLYASAPNKPMCLSGLSNSGCLAGYYIHHQTGGGGGRSITYPHAFVWDGTALYDANTALQALASITTCMSPAGVMAGVGWTNANPSTQPAQFGFIWNQGVIHTFSSPDGTSIDAVVAVNDAGHVIGTYFGTGSYKRAFYWDGTTSVDLGDFGDPDNSFIWPKALNNSGQIVGTVYYYAEGIPQGSDAFLWQDSAMSAIDADGNYSPSSGIGINASGEIVCAYDQANFVNPTAPLASGFSWVDDLLFTLTPLANHKGVTPFAINDAHQIIGTAYAGDGTLHLFTSLAGTPLTTNQGPVALNAGDTAFRLTGINSGGNAVGFVNDASNHAQAVWRRLNEPAGTMHCIAAMLPPGVSFVADASSGTTVLVNDQGRVACTGYDGAGQPVLLLLLPDSDGDGIPDEWETAHGLNPYDASDASGDADGDGLTNLQEFQQGSDPNDFFNGQPAKLVIVGGDHQTGTAGGYLPAALVVQVTNAIGTPVLTPVPVAFSVASGGLLQATSTATPASTVTLTTDGNGQAHVYLRLLPTEAPDIQVTATSGNAPAQTFQESATGSGGAGQSPFAPTNVVATLNKDGSLDVSWENSADNDSTDPIPVRVKLPGDTYATQSVPADQTSAHFDAP